MKSAVRVTMLGILWGIALALGIVLVFPRGASAETVTRQILPLGGASCVPVSVIDFVPHMYDGALHSFDLTVPDASYVAISGLSGTTQIPFNYITRRMANGGVRMHVDLPTTRVSSILPISLTLISAKGPMDPVCLTVFTTNIPSPTPTPVPAPTQQPATPTQKPVQVTPAPARPSVSQTPPTPVKPAVGATSTVRPTASVRPSSATDTAREAATSVTRNVSEQLALLCSRAGGGERVFGLMLLIHALLILAAAIWARGMEEKQTWVVAAAIIPFLIILGLWYASVACRNGWWPLGAALLVAFAGLYLSTPSGAALVERLRKHPDEQTTLKI